MKNFMRRHRSFLFALTALFIVRGSFADQYFVPSGSMEPTIQVGDHIFVDKLAYDVRLPFTDIVLAQVGEPARGDIVVCFHPVTGLRLVKRVTGVPGDVVQTQRGKEIVPPGHYFVMGDNRDNSSDSRIWGYMPRENIQARARGVLFNAMIWPYPKMDVRRIAKLF